MKQIELKRIIQMMGVPKDEIALKLFPERKDPMSALNRMIRHKNLLNENQIRALAELGDFNILEIFIPVWKSRFKKNLIIFHDDEYKAKLDVENMNLNIYYKEVHFHTSIVYPKDISMSKFFSILENAVLDFIRRNADILADENKKIKKWNSK